MCFMAFSQRSSLWIKVRFGRYVDVGSFAIGMLQTIDMPGWQNYRSQLDFRILSHEQAQV